MYIYIVFKAQTFFSPFGLKAESDWEEKNLSVSFPISSNGFSGEQQENLFSGMGFYHAFNFPFIGLLCRHLQAPTPPPPHPHSLQYVSCTLDCTQRKTVGCQVGDYFHHGKKQLSFWSFCTKILIGKFSVTSSSGQRLISAEYQVVALQGMKILLSGEIFLFIWFGNLCEILGQDGWGLIAWYSPIPISFRYVFALATVDNKVSFNWHALGGGYWFSDVTTSKCRHLHSQLLTSYLFFSCFVDFTSFAIIVTVFLSSIW